MDPIKKLAGQTAVYGLGTIVPRLLSWLLLTPFFTRIFQVGEYGVVTELYAYVILLLAILTYGMETGFFRFSETEKDPKTVYSSSLILICITTLTFIIGVNIFIKGTSIGTTTNAYGFYSLTTSAKNITIVFSYIGYESVEEKISLNKNLTLDVE